MSKTKNTTCSDLSTQYGPNASDVEIASLTTMTRHCHSASSFAKDGGSFPTPTNKSTRSRSTLTMSMSRRVTCEWGTIYRAVVGHDALISFVRSCMSPLSFNGTLFYG